MQTCPHILPNLKVSQGYESNNINILSVKDWREICERELSPTAFATSLAMAPVASRTANMALMLEICWGKKELAAYTEQHNNLLLF